MIKKLVNRLGLPLAVALVLIISLATVVGANGLYEVWHAHVSATINEPIVVTIDPNTLGWSGPVTHQWAVSMYPGETKELVLNIVNNSPLNMPVMLSIAGTTSELTFVFQYPIPTPVLQAEMPITLTHNSGGTNLVKLLVTASSSCAVGIQTFDIVVSR